MSLPQREELAREENQFFAAKNNSTENQFFTHKTNSSSGGDSIHSELMTPPSDRCANDDIGGEIEMVMMMVTPNLPDRNVTAIFPRHKPINISRNYFSLDTIRR